MNFWLANRMSEWEMNSIYKHGRSGFTPRSRPSSNRGVTEEHCDDTSTNEAQKNKPLLQLIS